MVAMKMLMITIVIVIVFGDFVFAVFVFLSRVGRKQLTLLSLSSCALLLPRCHYLSITFVPQESSSVATITSPANDCVL